MKSLSLLVLLSYSISSIEKSNAQDSVQLNQGTPAPYSGYLISKEKVQQFYQMDLENKELKLMNESFSRSVQFYKNNDSSSATQITSLLYRNDDLAKELASARTTTSFEKVAYFVGGILIAGFGVWGAQKLKQ